MDTPSSILDVTPEMAESMSRKELHALAKAEIEAEHERLTKEEQCGSLLSVPEASFRSSCGNFFLMLLNMALPFLALGFWFRGWKVVALFQMVICVAVLLLSLVPALGDLPLERFLLLCYIFGVVFTLAVDAIRSIWNTVGRARYRSRIASAVGNKGNNPYRCLKEKVPETNFKEKAFYEKFVSWATVREAHYDELLRVAAPTIDLGAAVSAVQQVGAKLGEKLGEGLQDAQQVGAKLGEKLGVNLEDAKQLGGKLKEKLGEGLQDAQQAGAKLGEKLGVNLEDAKQLGGKLKEKLWGRSSKG